MNGSPHCGVDGDSRPLYEQSYDDKQLGAVLAPCEVCAREQYFSSSRRVCTSCLRWAANVIAWFDEKRASR